MSTTFSNLNYLIIYKIKSKSKANYYHLVMNSVWLHMDSLMARDALLRTCR